VPRRHDALMSYSESSLSLRACPKRSRPAQRKKTTGFLRADEHIRLA